MSERVFFNKLITKDLSAVSGSDRRVFEGYLTVQMVDKQNEITIVDELMKAVPIWMARGAPISDTHSNRIVGKGIGYEKTTITENGVTYPAIFIQAEIFKDYELDDEIWKNIKSGKYKGLSFGGATRSDRTPVTNKDGTTSYALKDLEHYEVAVCEDPAVPLALITDFNNVVKAIVSKNGGKYEARGLNKHCIRCNSFGCYVDKSFNDTKITDDDPAVVQGHENTDTDGVNRPQKDPTQVTSGNQQDPTGNDPTFRGSAGKSKNTHGSYPSAGDAYDDKPVLDKAEDLEEEEKTLNPGENMNMEKPIRGLRGTGGLGGGGSSSSMISGAKSAEEKEKYDYDMRRIVNDEETNDPRKDKNVGTTIEATGEEGGKPRVGNDEQAEGFSANDSTKGDIAYATGGTRGGSYDNTDQDSQQWDRQVSGKHGRDTKVVDRGDKDSLNTLNRSLDKLKAIEIRRAIANL